jgi:hypothetical protein
MVIVQEATGTFPANRRREIGVDAVRKAGLQFHAKGTPEDFALLFCDMMIEMGASLDILSKSPANDFLKKMSREITSYAVKSQKAIALL